ncbi:ATP-dependent exonuclease [Flavobacteriales bacterium 34_180_T64]|nr:ATP-dependent exonuclease [Flavobacteriales bacterium 34_180_T64]
MKKTVLIIIALLCIQVAFTQEKSAFQDGEWFKFKMSYSGFLKAGNATLSVKETALDGKQVYHVVGKGWTTGAIKWFFKVKDRYESYFDKTTGMPYRFIRKIDEGGHTKDIEIAFDHTNKEALIENKKKKTQKVVATEQDVQDMVSAFYYLRNNYDTDEIKVNDVVSLNMFFDAENYIFKLKFLGRETIETKFGKVKTLKFRPYVMAGRVFKEQESLTLWVSADDNKIPLKIKADLAVGSLRADLVAFKGLKHSFEIQFE